jgi:Leucine-rich repeat (LRR) protein
MSRINSIQSAIKLLLAVLLITNETSALYVSSRIQCEYRDKNGDSLILNCTLVTGQLSQSQQPSDQSPSSSILVNNIDLSGGGSGGGMVSASNSLNVKAGLEKTWRTPWESLTINHNIIRTLIWSNSKLAELGEFAFKDLNFLQKLDLSGNKLQHIQMSVFKSFELDLVDLDLSQNAFQFVPEKIFLNKRLENLEILRLNENPIQLVNANSFENLKNLKLLELNYCQIKSIEANSFDNLKQLESLSLIGNHLRYLNEYTFRAFNLRSFYVHENPLVCDCNLRWLLDFIKNVDYQQQIYESQLTLSIPSLSSSSPHLNRYNQKDQAVKVCQIFFTV